MKWLEGWFGVASAVLGIAWIAFTSVLVPVTMSSRSCESLNGGPTHCYGPNGAPVSPNGPGPNVGLIILLAVVLLLYIGVLVGTLLDLNGVRTAGRIILLISSTLLILGPFIFFSTIGSLVPGSVAVTYPLTLLAFAAGVLACVRRDTPRPATPALG